MLTFFVSADRRHPLKSPVFPVCGRSVSSCPRVRVPSQAEVQHLWEFLCVRRPKTAYLFVSAHFLLSEWTRNVAAEGCRSRC